MCASEQLVAMVQKAAFPDCASKARLLPKTSLNDAALKEQALRRHQLAHGDLIDKDDESLEAEEFEQL